MRIKSIVPGGSTLMAAAFVILAAGTTFAQDHRPGQPMHHQMQEMRGQPMMMAMMEGPRMALRERERLGLSEDQVRELEAVQDRMRQAHRQPMERMRAMHRELAAAMNDELDEAEARAALQRMAEVRTEMGLAMLRARQETRAILTEQQRERLSEVGREHMGQMQRMRGMMREERGMGRGMMGPGMMMMLCPMMQDDSQDPESEPHDHEH